MAKPVVAVKQFKSAKEVRDFSKRTMGNGGLQSVPKEGCIVRFLDDPEEWIHYQEYYDKENKAFVPVVEGDALPDGARPSSRYIANVVWKSEGTMEGKVVAFKMPKKAAISVLNKYDKYGTLADRDYEFARYGEGMDTEYDVTPESPSKMVLTKFTKFDLIEKLTEEYERAMGRINGDDESDDEPKSKIASAGKKKQARGDDDEDSGPDLAVLAKTADKGDEDAQETLTALAEEMDLDPDEYPTWKELVAAMEEAAESDDDEEEAEEEEAEDDEDEAEPDEEEEAAEEVDIDALKADAKKADKGNAAAQGRITEVAEAAELDPDDYPTWVELVDAIEEVLGGDADEDADDEDEDADEDEDDEEAEIDLDTLNGMSLAELREFAETYDIEHKGLTKKALIQAIVDAAEE